MKKLSTIFFYGFLMIACWSGVTACRDSGSKSPLPYQSFPFYKDFSKLDTGHLKSGLEQLKTKYPGFLDFYLDTLIGLGVHHRYSDTLSALKKYLSFDDYRNLFDTVNKAFPDTKEIDEQLREALRHIHDLDTGFILPNRVFYFVSGLSMSALTHHNTDLGIGLDMFLGRDFAPYASVGIPYYATIRFTKENIPVWACRAIYQNRFPFTYEDKSLLEMMIEKGKEIYFLQQALPDAGPGILLGYTPHQLAWCEQNEALIYNFFIQNDLLYEKNLQKVMRYLTDGPATPGFSEESPGNIGSYLGWKIVTEFAVNAKPEPAQLLTESNAQKILTQANYKP